MAAHSSHRWSPAPLIRSSAGLHALALLGVGVWPSAWPWLAGAVAANHAALTLCGLHPRNALLGHNMTRLPQEAVERGQVALTFDDGPDPAATPRLLDLLDQHAAKASFFCIGQRAARHPDLVREMARRGHGVENHTDTHPMAFACLSPGALRREITTAQVRLADIVGAAPRFFRPPMGIRSPLLDPVLVRLGLRHVSWTRRGLDTVSSDPARVLSRLSGGLAAGDILLLHDGAAGRRAAAGMVIAILPSLLGLLADAALQGVSLTLGTRPVASGGETATE